MEKFYNSCIDHEVETCVIEEDSLPPYFIEESIDYEGKIRVHGYYDLEEAKSDFADFRADMTIIAAALYCNSDDGPYMMDVFSHRNSYVQAEFNCTFADENVKGLFAEWLEMNNIDFHRFQSDDGSYEIHVYCATDWEENATIQWLNAHAATNTAE